jgi:hypothetical protein
VSQFTIMKSSFLFFMATLSFSITIFFSCYDNKAFHLSSLLSSRMSKFEETSARHLSRTMVHHVSVPLLCLVSW